MTLVLLYRFSESQESLLGYELCKKLVKEGHHLYVTTTTPKSGALTKEIQNAKIITETSKGSITLLQPEYDDEAEEPSPEWIANNHKHYFRHLVELQNVDTIVGTLPGTIQTAVDLKEVLNCRLVLLATTKIAEEHEELKKEISDLAKSADKILSVGADLLSHYQNIFQEEDSTSNGKHKEILLKPTTKSIKYWEYNTTRFKTQRTGTRKLVSVWNDPYPSFYKGKEVYSKGSDIETFSSLSSALGEINTQAVLLRQSRIQWNVHGLKFQDQIIRSIERKAKPNLIQITPLSPVNSIDDLTWKNCLAFIVPEIVDDTFNFVALSALWLGIPTIVSSQSSVGRLLLSLACPQKTRAVITLTGNSHTDKETWKKKIHRDIFNEEARPMEWARTLSEHLHYNIQLWNLDILSVKDQGQRQQWSCDSLLSTSSTLSAVEPEENSVEKVLNWRTSTPLERAWSWDSSPMSQASESYIESSMSLLKVPNFRICPYHNHFCEQCNAPTCSECNRNSHKNHKAVPFVQKSQDLIERLQLFISHCSERDKEIKRRYSVLDKCHQDIETSTASAVEQMDAKHKFVRAELDRVYNEELDSIYKLKREEQLKLQTEISQLEMIEKYHRHAEENALGLLTEQVPLILVIDVIHF